MSDWLPLVVILGVIVFAVIMALVVSINIKTQGNMLPDDFADTHPLVPECINVAPEEVDLDPDTLSVEKVQVPTVPINPALQVAQDNLNYTLWHKMVWLIPNAIWVNTQHQSLTKVQWLCLGPDHHYFIAHAELFRDEWKWTFTKA